VKEEYDAIDAQLEQQLWLQRGHLLSREQYDAIKSRVIKPSRTLDRGSCDA
jgi:hypothetical protein